MLRDVFYFGEKPNVHPREKFAVDLADARSQCTTEHFWIVNEFCDYKGFDWDWDFDFLQDEDVWTREHNNVWPSHYQKDGGTWLCSENESEIIVYRGDVDPIPRKDIIVDNWIIPESVDIKSFDFKWHPDPTDPPFIYQFGTQWQKTGGPRYVVEDATEVKYIQTQISKRLPDLSNWKFLKEIDKESFDFSWHPDDSEPPFIYEFGTQWQPKGGLQYTVPGATETKYEFGIVVKSIQVDKASWYIPSDIDDTDFDFTWHPDPTDPPMSYHFGTQWAKTNGPVFNTGGSDIKYVDTQIAKMKPNLSNWEIPENLDITEFDFSWHPDSTDGNFKYVFGTQWQKTGGPTFIATATPDSEIKYIDLFKVKHLATKNNTKWNIPHNVLEFDYSWHPDATEEPYIYQFGSKHSSIAGPQFIVEVNAPVKYIDDPVAVIKPDMSKWHVPDNIDTTDFDFSWTPDISDKPYIYEFGTQWQKTSGPRYIVEDATEIKYVDTQHAIHLSEKTNWVINYPTEDFDYSWHPDATEEPYIYQFPSQWNKNSGPRYVVPGATEVKYVSAFQAVVKTDMSNWIIPEGLDTTSFDFSWHPDVEDQPYIYEFGTQWQKTGGPQYIVKGATEVKYIDTLKAIRLLDNSNWSSTYTTEDFDYSWHPDSTEQPYIYQFPSQWGKNGGPRYTVEGATEVKYVDVFSAIVKPDMKYWVIPDNVDTTGFDFSWHPDVEDQPYIYEFGTQWQKTGGPRYVVEGATDVKYIDTLKVKALSNKTYWKELIPVDPYDDSWHPDATEEPFIYVFGNQWNNGELEPTLQYVVPGATIIKYVTDIPVHASAYAKGWELLENVKSFDFSWRPNPTDPPYIYVFGNKQYPGTIMPTVKLHVLNATQEKFVDDIIATLASKPELFVVPKQITDFDYSWRPNPKDPPYIYQFGTQWAKTNGPQYIIKGATETKFIDYPKATIAASNDNWEIPTEVDVSEFDFSWHPDGTNPPYIYIFGTQWQKTGGPIYKVEGATEIKYVSDIKAKSFKVNKHNWVVPTNIDTESFDFTWYPDPTEEPFIYQFGTQWAKTHGPRYVVEGAVETKFVNYPIAVAKKDMTNWFIPPDTNITGFDFSWHPDGTSPPYIYQFGTIVDENDGPKYITPGHDNEIVHLERPENINAEVHFSKYYIDTTLEDLIAKHKGEVFWALNPDIDYSEFNFEWRPSIEQVKYIHAFGTKENINTQTYFVNTNIWYEGFTDINYIEDNSLVIRTTLDMFFVDKSNIDSQRRFLELQQRFPRIQKTRYLNSWVETINRCLNKSSTKLCWILNSELDYSDFEFDYYPNPWQMTLVHVFGTQYSHWGTTFMVNKDTFGEDTKYIKIIEHLSMLNFIKNRRATATDCLYDMYVIDHGNKETPMIVNALKQKTTGRGLTTVVYSNSYFETFKKLLKTLPDRKEHYIWVCSSICDYSNFDFKYICDPFAREQLHVFPSDKQKFGDTFLVDVNRLRELVDTMDILEDYHKINYNQHMRVKRLPAPTIITEGDTHVSSIHTDFDWPYATFQTFDNKEITVHDTEPMSLWDEKHKNIIVTTTGATRIIVPKEAKNYVKRELYDYPHMIKNFKLVDSQPLDIVFLSNGEKGADENYEHLLKVTKGLSNRVVRVDGVNGRVAAYHAAAEASNTPWMFTVFAKLQVDSKFDWNWQPDRLQVPKHYIFNAKNPVNLLEYGHQAMIAYNKRITLANSGRGLDFTLDDEHEVVDMLSGVAMFNTDEWSTWRTSFREALKLKATVVANPDDSDSVSRLLAWSTIGHGNFSEYSINGALDAIEYYDSVEGDLDKLRLSYDWPWLKEYFNNKYS